MDLQDRGKCPTPGRTAGVTSDVRCGVDRCGKPASLAAKIWVRWSNPSVEVVFTKVMCGECFEGCDRGWDLMHNTRAVDVIDINTYVVERILGS